MRTASPMDLLVIEDDEDARLNLCDILEMDDYRVATAGTAAEALGRDDLETFAAIILDRRLPDATADELLPKLQRRAPGTAVLVVTGYSDLQGAIAALRQGAADYILKPINPDALRASLERITERRQLTLAKERSEAAFRHLVEAAECLIIIVGLDLSILYFNPFAERITGYAEDEVRGRPYDSVFLHEVTRPLAMKAMDRALTGESVRGFENPVVCRDGSRRWIVWNVHRLDDYEGEPVILGVGQDLTRQKEAQERALQAERLAAIGQMMTGLAHESRNALQRSQACLEMLARLVRQRPDELDLIDRIQRAQDHLHHLYEDVRHYAAPIRLERKACSLADVWREAWSDLENLRRDRSAVLLEDLGGLDLRCKVDAFRLGQVFRNILENALGACADPVEITIRSTPDVLDGRSAICVSIVDNGPGLDPEQSRMVFEPFFTTKTKGTGLGMAIARRVVEAHGGQLTLGNSSGAEFLITLPRGET